LEEKALPSGQATLSYPEGHLAVGALEAADPGRAGPGRWCPWAARGFLRHGRRAELRQALWVTKTRDDAVSTVPAETDAVEVPGEFPAPAEAGLLDVLSLSKLLPLAL